MRVITGSYPICVNDRHADLTLLHPYAFPFSSKSAGALTRLLLAPKSSRGRSDRAYALLRRLFEVPRSSKVLAVSHENLDRAPWTLFGDALRSTDLPRLTFWPRSIDPIGFRFPYWWSYVDWPDIPRPRDVSHSRFGEAYDLETLCSPQELELKDRHDRAVWLTNHLDFPRDQIRNHLQQYVQVDIVQDIPWGSKASLLRTYRYCVVSENSPGYGYETEKLPEARLAGCVPIGYEANPFSQFREDSYFFSPPRVLPERLPPLLKSRPNLGPFLEYLASVIDGNPRIPVDSAVIRD